MTGLPDDSALDAGLRRLFVPPPAADLGVRASERTPVPARRRDDLWRARLRGLAAVAALVLGVLALLRAAETHGLAVDPSHAEARFDATELALALAPALDCKVLDAPGGEQPLAGLLESATAGRLTSSLQTVGAAPRPCPGWEEAVAIVAERSLLIVAPSRADRRVIVSAGSGLACHRAAVGSYVLYEIAPGPASLLSEVRACAVPDAEASE